MKYKPPYGWASAAIGLGAAAITLLVIVIIVYNIDATACTGNCEGYEERKSIRKANEFCINQGYINSTQNIDDITRHWDSDWIYGNRYKTTYCVDENNNLSESMIYEEVPHIITTLLIIMLIPLMVKGLHYCFSGDIMAER